jgi:hypothetical protein
LAELATLRVVQCRTDPVTALARMADRAVRAAHADVEVIGDNRYFDDFDRLALSAPSIDVDTTSGYEPSIERVVSFVNR